MKTVFISPDLGADLNTDVRQRRLLLRGLGEDPAKTLLWVLSRKDEPAALAKLTAELVPARAGRRVATHASAGSRLRHARAVWKACSGARRVFCASLTSLPLAAVALRPGGRLLLSLRDTDLAHLGPLRLLALRRCTRVLCDNVFTRDTLAARLPSLAARLRVASPALSLLSPDAAPPRPPPVGEPPLVLCPLPLHGRSLAVAEQAVHIFSRLPSAAFHGIPALMPRLRFCGEGGGIERLLRAARRDHVEDRVNLEPARDLAELRAAYAAATCSLLPDPAGPAMENLLDALASGRPCVAHARGAAGELLSPANSVLATDDDPAALSAALAECLVRVRDTDTIWRDAQAFDYAQLRSTLMTAWS